MKNTQKTFMINATHSYINRRRKKTKLITYTTKNVYNIPSIDQHNGNVKNWNNNI